MHDISLIILTAGTSSRFGQNVKKQWLRIGHDPLWLFVTNQLKSKHTFKKVILSAHADEIEFMKMICDERIVTGGDTRADSLKNALKEVSTTHVLVSDVARACITQTLVSDLISSLDKADCIVPYIGVSDTVTFNEQTIDRDKLRRIQTPQLSLTSSLKDALMKDGEFTDESSAIVANGGSREFVLSSLAAEKITYLQDLQKLECLENAKNVTLVGNGLDVHEFEDGKTMYLGGVKIESDFGFKAHSDGDVAIHSLIDSLLGAAGLGDIGMLFPENDDTYKGIDSKILLAKTVSLIENFGYEIVNVDLTIAAEVPRLSKYKTQIRHTLSKVLKIPSARVNVKATTTEKLGFVGRKEGVAVFVTSSLNYFNWKNL